MLFSIESFYEYLIILLAHSLKKPKRAIDLHFEELKGHKYTYLIFCSVNYQQHVFVYLQMAWNDMVLGNGNRLWTNTLLFVRPYGCILMDVYLNILFKATFSHFLSNMGIIGKCF
jgi:hypothetical protein